MPLYFAANISFGLDVSSCNASLFIQPVEPVAPFNYATARRCYSPTDLPLITTISRRTSSRIIATRRSPAIHTACPHRFRDAFGSFRNVVLSCRAMRRNTSARERALITRRCRARPSHSCCRVSSRIRTSLRTRRHVTSLAARRQHAKVRRASVHPPTRCETRADECRFFKFSPAQIRARLVADARVRVLRVRVSGTDSSLVNEKSPVA